MTLSGKQRSVFIETPMGIIEIERLDNRQLRFIGPDGVVVHRSEERALRGAQYVTKDSSGKLHPKYQILVPKVDEDGALAGVDQPPVYRAPRLALA